jgi:hypothetical protein
MAVVDSAERDVVVLVGVPLFHKTLSYVLACAGWHAMGI